MGKPETGKTEVIYCRVNAALKKRLEAEAKDNERGEAEAVIVRRALHEYFDRRDHPDKYPPLKEGQHYQYNDRAAEPPVVPSPPAPPPSAGKAEDITTEKLGRRAVSELPGSPVKPVVTEPPPAETEGKRMHRKVVGIVRRAAAGKSAHQEKHGK